ncbi:MAG: hypothetical protein SGBAC_012376 [Bacillariaceae sp.]
MSSSSQFNDLDHDTNGDNDTDADADAEASASAIVSSDKSSSSSSFKLQSLVESAVQRISGDKDYQLGDYVKKGLNDLTGKDYSSSNATFEIGKITSEIVSNTIGDVISSGSNDDQYSFGDITTRAIRRAGVSLHTWKGRTLDPTHLYRQYMGQFTPDQKKILIVSFLRFLAIALVTWGFYGNLSTALYFSGGWLKTCLAVDPIDLMLKQHQSLIGVSQAFWKANSPLIIRNFIKFRLFLTPLMLVVQGAATALSVLPIEKFVTFLEQKCIPKGIQSRFPIWTHGIALVLLFGIGLGILAIVSSIGIATGTTLAYLFKWQSTHTMIS